MLKISKLKYILISLMIILSSFGQIQANDTFVPVRVGISDTNFKNYLFTSVEFNNPQDINILDSSSGYTVPIDENTKIVKVTSENNLFRIYVNDELVARNLTGSILVSAKEGCLISINNLKRKGKQALYRGYIELKRSDKDISKFAIVNVLSLKNYLRGVVPNEMPVRFGLEALKAQTVAARNYAVTPRIKAYTEFDLCDSVACQVYFGANTEDTLSDKAIEETNGIIAIDNENNPILALYSSTAGGYTESYEYAFSNPETKQFPSNDIHYLTATADNKNFGQLNSDEKAEEFYTSNPVSYDDISPYYRWSKEWTKDELEKVLAKTLISQSKTGFINPQLINEKDFGKLISIKPILRGNSGKIIELEIKTTTQTFIVKKELVIRRCFQKDGVSLPSANFVISSIESERPVYKFSGGGFGHGVGLSQWGAGKMASLGFSYTDILQHYYQGIRLATIPIKINNNYKIYEQNFYSNSKEAQIIISNKNNCIKKLKVVVNNEELELKLKDEQMCFDISKYIEIGNNKVSFLILDEKMDIDNELNVFVLIKDKANE